MQAAEYQLQEVQFARAACNFLRSLQLTMATENTDFTRNCALGCRGDLPTVAGEPLQKRGGEGGSYPKFEINKKLH